MLDFKFSNALLHYFRSDAPSGFLLKFSLSYLFAAIIVGGISMVAMRPLIEFYIELFSLAGSGVVDATDEEAVALLFQEQMNGFGQFSGLLFLLMLILALAMWAVFEASIQRHYVRKDRFRLRLGNDEWRLMAVGIVVYLLMFVVMLVAAIPMGIIVGVATASASPTIAAVGIVAGYVVFLGIFAWFIARISAASALTIRDERVRIFESFRVTKGRFWPIFGVIFIVWIVVYVLQLLIFGAGIFSIVAQFGDLVTDGANLETAEIIAKLQTPTVAGTIGVLTAVLVFTYGVFMVLIGGPGALAALNDPDRPFQGADASDVFD